MSQSKKRRIRELLGSFHHAPQERKMGKTHRNYGRDYYQERSFLPPAVRREDRSLQIVPALQARETASAEARRQNRPQANRPKQKGRVEPCQNATGVVKFVKDDKGYGFITIIGGPQAGKEVFFHRKNTVLVRDLDSDLKQGDKVKFDVVIDQRDPTKTCAIFVCRM